MLIPRPSLTAAVCALGLLAAACATRTPTVVTAQPRAAASGAPIPTSAPPLEPEPDPTPELAPRGEADRFVETESEPALLDQLLADSAPVPPIATERTEQAVADDLQTVGHDIDIPLNARVLSYVELFSGRLKGYLEEGLSRGAQYLPMIQDVFRAEGLPLDLAYVPLIESAFKPNAVSRAKARGMWQFMRGTALENGLRHDWYIDERADPEKATRAAAKYLKTLHAMFDDWYLALASYNGGPGRVQRAMKRSGRADFWKLSATSRYLPRETRDYVPLILAATIIARNPSQYGLNIAPVESPAYEKVLVAGAVDLRRVAEWAEVPMQAIQDLNPELRRWTTPVRATDYELKVPLGTGATVETQLAESSADRAAPLNHYTVKKGDTLLAVARRLAVTRSDLAEANYLSTRATLKAGQQLVVPRAPALGAARPEPAPPSANAGDVDAVLASRSVDLGTPRSSVSTTHRVRRGDTLFSIAQRYSTTVLRIKEWNGLRSNIIHIGQRLLIAPLAALTN